MTAKNVVIFLKLFTENSRENFTSIFVKRGDKKSPTFTTTPKRFIGDQGNRASMKKAQI